MRRRTFLRGAGLAGLAGAGASAVAAGAGRGRSEATEGYEPLGRVPVEGAAEAVVGPAGETAFVATGDGFATVDVSDPSAPAVLARETDVAADREGGPLESILDVAVDGDRLLVSGPAQRGALQGLVVYDVSDPATPTPATEFHETSFRIHNADLQDGYAYLTNNADAGRPLTVVDVSGATPVEAGRWSPLDADVGVEGWSSIPALPGTLHDVTVHDGVAYCAYWDAGTWLVDVSDPAAPGFVGRAGDYSLSDLVEVADDRETFRRLFWEAPGNDHYADVDEAASLLAVGAEAWDDPETEGGGPGGIRLYDVADPASPELLARINPPVADDTSFGGTWVTAHNFELHGDRLYSSWYQGGVKVHDVSDPRDPERLVWWRNPATTYFWTARTVPGTDAFVAPDYPEEGEGNLFVFPDRAGEQADPPETVRDPETRVSPPTTATVGTTATATTATTTTPTTAASTTTTAPPTDPGTTTATPTEVATETRPTPGFGAVAAGAAAGGLAAYRYLRRRGDGD